MCVVSKSISENPSHPSHVAVCEMVDGRLWGGKRTVAAVFIIQEKFPKQPIMRRVRAAPQATVGQVQAALCQCASKTGRRRSARTQLVAPPRMKSRSREGPRATGMARWTVYGPIEIGERKAALPRCHSEKFDYQQMDTHIGSRNPATLGPSDIAQSRFIRAEVFASLTP